MDRSFTKAFNLSRYLLMVFETRGLEGFEEELRRCAGFIVDNTSDSREINNRLQVIISGILGSLLGGQTELIFRQQMQLTENFINESDHRHKVNHFVADTTDFLRRFEEGDGDTMFSERVISFLKGMPLEDFQAVTIDSLAQCFCYSAGHFSSKFREETGKRLQEVLMNERLNRAFEMFQKKGLKPTVKEVAEMVGFSDPHYFSQLFRKRYGLLPSDLVH